MGQKTKHMTPCNGRSERRTKYCQGWAKPNCRKDDCVEILDFSSSYRSRPRLPDGCRSHTGTWFLTAMRTLSHHHGSSGQGGIIGRSRECRIIIVTVAKHGRLLLQWFRHDGGILFWVDVHALFQVGCLGHGNGRGDWNGTWLCGRGISSFRKSVCWQKGASQCMVGRITWGWSFSRGNREALQLDCIFYLFSFQIDPFCFVLKILRK